MSTPVEVINIAFANDAKLRKRIFDAINVTPQHTALFEDIAKYQLASQQFSIVNSKADKATEQPLKKRKLDDGAVAVDQPRTVIFEARDISFTLPQRKKLHLSIVQYGEKFTASTTTFALCGRNPATSQVEFEYPATAFAYALRVPVPEKAQKQYNFCILPSQAQPASSPVTTNEAIIWTVNHGPLKSCQILSKELQGVVGTENILENTLDAILHHSGKKLVYPTDAEFVSALVESHRRGDKSYHVKAFRGSKDGGLVIRTWTKIDRILGYLFFLENGIFFGFKKPLSFFPFDEIDSVSYTAVLQRTFNLVITVRAMDATEQQEIELSMIDQADFAGIDAYIKRHELQDSSMAEARRAKQFKVNGSKGNEAEREDSDGRTEIEKAEQELEDEEDEMEEDYDPGSDGESEGSGSSDDDDAYEYTKAGAGKDLVKDELGSEAEDVELSEEEEQEAEEEEEEEEEEEDFKKGMKATDGYNNVDTTIQHPVQRLAVNKPLSLAVQPQFGGPDLNDEDQL